MKSKRESGKIIFSPIILYPVFLYFYPAIQHLNRAKVMTSFYKKNYIIMHLKQLDMK